MVLKNNVKIVHREQTLLRRYYDFLSIKILNGLLYCYGTYNQTGIEYKYRIKYNGYSAPSVKIISPLIEMPYHTYNDGTLCLYYPKETPWDCDKLHLYDTFIPWTHQWILFYEIYRQTGVWAYPEIVHNDEK